MIRKIENLAYNYHQGDSGFPCLVFLPGFRSDMNGTKAQYLYQECVKRGQSCLLLDYSGHGQSGGKFEDGTIGQWTQDALAIIDAVTKDDLMLVGSSMGGWIALLIAIKRPERVSGLMGIAAGPDFTRSIKSRLTDEYRKDLENKGYFAVPSEYGDDLIITQKLLDEGEAQCILDRTWDLKIPVVLVQGKRDPDVPWQTAEKIKDSLPESNVEIVYIEDGDHRLSREDDLKLIGEYAERISDLSHAGGG